MAEKDTVFPVSEGPPQRHPPGQPLHPGVLGIQALLPLPGPVPITEACLEHSDPVESLSHLCKQRESLCAAPASIFKISCTLLPTVGRDRRLFL